MSGALARDIARVVAQRIARADLSVTAVDEQLDLLLLGSFGAGRDGLCLRVECLPAVSALGFNGPAVIGRYHVDVIGWHGSLFEVGKVSAPGGLSVSVAVRKKNRVHGVRQWRRQGAATGVRLARWRSRVAPKLPTGSQVILGPQQLFAAIPLLHLTSNASYWAFHQLAVKQICECENYSRFV